MIQLGSAYGEIQIGTGEAEKSVASLASAMRSVGTSMSLALSAPLLGIAAAGLNAAGSFEQSMNQMQVVSGATAEAMSGLQAQALQLGRDTSFSAGEAAEGMLELAKAGMSAKEVAASISGTLDLAAAGNIAVAQAAEISANALNTFGLDASEAGRVADLLAAAANSSSVEITDMAQGMTMAGAVFAANKVPIEDLSTAIALLGNNGIKGSDAGTSLKTMLMRLTAPAKEATGAMADLGIEVYNADGSMRKFDDILAQLESSTSGLTDAQRNQALTTIFGADAIRAANILIKEGSAGFADMKEKVTAAGAAQEMADARMKGFAGAIDYLKGTIESTLIEAFLPFLDGMGGMLRQTADLIAQFTSLPEPVRNAALAFAAVLAVAGPVMLAISGIATVLGLLLSPIGLVVLAVAALAAAWSADFMGIRETTAAAWAAISPVLDQTVTGFGYYTEAVADAGFGSIESREAITALPAALQPVALAFDNAAASIQRAWGEGFPQVMAQARAAWDALMTLLEPALSRLQAAFGTAGTQVAGLAPHFEGLLAAVQNMWAAVQPILQAFGAFIAGVIAVVAVVSVNLLAAVFEKLGAIVGTVIDQITLTINTFAGVMTEVVTLITAIINGDWATAWQSAQNILQLFKTFFTGTFNNLRTLVTTVIGVIYTTVINTLTDLGIDTDGLLTTLRTAFASAWNAIESRVKTAIQGINGAFETMHRWLTSTLLNALTAFQDFLKNLHLPNPFDALLGALDGIQSAIDGARSAIDSFIGWLGGLSVPNPFAGISFPSWPGGGSSTPSAWPSGVTPSAAAGATRSAPAFAGASAATATWTIENHFHVTGEMDLESAARRIVEMIRARGA